MFETKTKKSYLHVVKQGKHDIDKKTGRSLSPIIRSTSPQYPKSV